MTKTMKKAKQLVVAFIGFTILVIGIAMIVLPGPAIIIIPVGLGILATEFVWARKLLRAVREQIKRRTSAQGSSLGDDRK
jgi:uncharacterized protein (TIGR02611 family)